MNHLKLRHEKLAWQASQHPLSTYYVLCVGDYCAVGDSSEYTCGSPCPQGTHICSSIHPSFTRYLLSTLLCARHSEQGTYRASVLVGEAGCKDDE